MMRLVKAMRAIGAASGAVVLLAFAVASAAGATTIYACVSKKSGAMRVVSAKAKCRHGEHRLSFSSTGSAGPAGAPGAPGAAGKQGTSGVGVDFGTSRVGSEPTRLATGGEDVVLSRTLPAGSYLVSAQVTLLAGEAKTPLFVVVACGIADSAGTPEILEPAGKAIDESVWLQTLAPTGTAGEYGGDTDMPLQAQLTTTTSTTLALICVPIEGTTGVVFKAFDPQLSALQTTANE
ncbi:MAG TPA: hypothetical protein VK790_02710 [Solirubrobacteraceae bacterium]|jgi:hypothetical protein|nr:hypothetical protein [Solirubrobacteraceae bacterium]